MSRIFNFRAYNTESDVMLSWDEIKEPIIIQGEVANTLSDVLTGELPMIPMQHTGVKDIDGVVIYEGDIVEFEGVLCRVSWSPKYCGFRLLRNLSTTTGLNIHHSRMYKVIGNLYENPDLIVVG